VTTGSSGGSTAETSSTSAEASSTAASTGAGGHGGEPPMEKIACGRQSCPFGNDNACCWDNYGLYGKPQAECVTGQPNADNCDTTETVNGGYETRIECQHGGQCAQGQVCCGYRFNGGFGTYYEATRCTANCTFPDLELCDGGTYPCPLIPGPMGGQVQSVCQPSSLLPQGYNVCGYP
jgi:hypothetical protein